MVSLEVTADLKGKILPVGYPHVDRYMILLTAALVAALLTLFLISVGLTSRRSFKTENISLKAAKKVEVLILVDNNRYDGLRSPWGLSMLVRACGHQVLFDTGPDPDSLRYNAEKLGVDLSKIDAVVISHEHGDHVGGLPYIAAVRPGVRVYVPEGMSPSVKRWIKGLGLTVVDVGSTTEICPCMAVIGGLYGPPYEEALAVRTDEGLVVLVGCSHPGVDRIVMKAENDLKVRPLAVIGGFHLAGASLGKVRSVVENLVAEGLSKIYPLHCSGPLVREVLRSSYPEEYEEAHVGSLISFGG